METGYLILALGQGCHLLCIVFFLSCPFWLRAVLRAHIRRLHNGKYVHVVYASGIGGPDWYREKEKSSRNNLTGIFAYVC